MNSIFLFDGKRVDSREIGFESLERAFLYGDGLFETMRGTNFRIFMRDKHMERLSGGLASCGMDMPEKYGDILPLIENLLAKEGIGDSCIRLNVWRKETGTLDPGDERKSRWLAIIKKFQPYPPDIYSRGISCMISGRYFKNEISPLSSSKTLNYLENMLAGREAKRNGCQRAILLNRRGEIAEGDISNIFFTRAGFLCTPCTDCGILPGITRQVVLDTCRVRGISIREGRFKPGILKEAGEIFMTGTLMGIVPVKSVKGLFEGTSFEMSRMLAGELERLRHRETSPKA